MNAGGLEPTHHSLMHPEKWFMFYRNCVTRSPIRPFVSQSEAACVHSRHALIHTPPYLFRLRHLPPEESHNPGCQTVKRRSRPPVTEKRLPAARLGRNMCTHAAECSHAGEGGAGSEEQNSFSADDLRCCDALPITDASADIRRHFHKVAVSDSLTELTDT